MAIRFSTKMNSFPGVDTTQKFAFMPPNPVGRVQVPFYPWEIRLAVLHCSRIRSILLIMSMSSILDAADPNLARYPKEKHGKPILYHGWGDSGRRPEPTLAYYKEVVAASGRTKALRRCRQTINKVVQTSSARNCSW
jgi:hypothetical protein